MSRGCPHVFVIKLSTHAELSKGRTGSLLTGLHLRKTAGWPRREAPLVTHSEERAAF